MLGLQFLANLKITHTSVFSIGGTLVEELLAGQARLGKVWATHHCSDIREGYGAFGFTAQTISNEFFFQTCFTPLYFLSPVNKKLLKTPILSLHTVTSESLCMRSGLDTDLSSAQC